MRFLLTVFIATLGPLYSSSQTYKVEEITYEFVVSEIEGLNSKYHDFSPIIYGEELIITSGRESNLVLQGENNWKNTGFLNVFSSKFKGELSATTSFSPPILYSEDIANNNHSGPVCFTASGDTVFFTQLEKIEKRVKKKRKPQLFMAVKNGKNWKNIEKLPFCTEDFSFGHPAWDKKNNRLYFASDVEGGKGGKDLYSVDLVNNEWTTVVNLDEFNTTSDELFPFIIENDLFFSSNREGGEGELDIYWKVLGHEQPLLPLDINTVGDDHGIFVLPGQTKGFFSKRVDGIDNVYFLDITRTVLITNELAGQFNYRNLDQSYASGLDIQLIYEDDIVMEAASDSSGKFAFRNLPFENYTIKLIGEEDVELVLFDKEGNQVTNLLQDGNGLFQYKKIDNQNAGTLSLLKDLNGGDDFAFRDISGQFAFEQLPGEYPDSLRVMLIDEDGNMVFSEYTDPRGNFTFKNIPIDQNFLIKTDEVDDDLFLFIYDEKGNVLTQLKQNRKGQFVYKKIKPDLANNLQYLAVNEDVFELETMTITGNFNYKKLEGEFNEGLTVYLYSEDGLLLDSAVTDKQGHFRFTSLSPDQAYLFKMNEDDPSFIMDDFNLHVEDRFGNVLADLYRAEDGFFKYKTIDADIADNLDTKDENDLDFQLDPTNQTENNNGSNNESTNNNTDSNNITETLDNTDSNNTRVAIGDKVSVFFDSNSSYANFKKNAPLNQMIAELKNSGSSIQINAHTDSRASDKYNLWLSERRGLRVKEYLINNGISESRIDIKAFGESQTSNCGDDSDCPDEEHAKNRRVDLQLTK
jgi:outer membrane protein OmpA-like peptidoglycan-associated protein